MALNYFLADVDFCPPKVSFHAFLDPLLSPLRAISENKVAKGRWVGHFKMNSSKDQTNILPFNKYL